MPLPALEREEADGQTAGRDLEGVRRTAIVRLMESVILSADQQGCLLRGWSDRDLASNRRRGGGCLAVDEMRADKAGSPVTVGS